MSHTFLIDFATIYHQRLSEISESQITGRSRRASVVKTVQRPRKSPNNLLYLLVHYIDVCESKLL